MGDMSDQLEEAIECGYSPIMEDESQGYTEYRAPRQKETKKRRKVEPKPAPAPVKITVPSVVPDLDEATYHADPVEGGSLSYSGMKQLLKSPAHYRHYMDAPKPTKKAFDAGHVIHALVLGTPLNVVEIPNDILGANGSATTMKAKQFVAEVRGAGLIPVKTWELDESRAIAEAVLTHPEAGPLFQSDLPAELSLFAADPRTGVNLRGRVDKVAKVDGETVLVDLKTCTDADPSEFRKDIANYGYYLQSTVYTRLWKLTHPNESIPEMWFVAVSKTQPHLVTINRVGLEYEDLGDIHMRRAIDRYVEGMTTGEWPGYPNIIWNQTPPGWLLAEEEAEEVEIRL